MEPGPGATGVMPGGWVPVTFTFIMGVLVPDSESMFWSSGSSIPISLPLTTEGVNESLPE